MNGNQKREENSTAENAKDAQLKSERLEGHEGRNFSALVSLGSLFSIGNAGADSVWQYRGQRRPAFAEAPGVAQESVWDYPRPPVIVPVQRRVEVRLGDLIIADSCQSFRILETASPPTFYISPHDVSVELLKRSPGTSVCEWKGVAQYWALKDHPQSSQAIGWSYPSPKPTFEGIRGFFSFYPAVVQCFVDGERVSPQPGGFYGGWVTGEIVGPFKGNAGTSHW